MGDDDTTVLDRVRQKGREAQARFRQRSKAHVVHLEQRIEQAQARIKQRQKHYRDLQHQQRSLVLGALELSNKMMDVGTQAVRAAKHIDVSARTTTQEPNEENRIRLAKKFTMFDTPIIPPRPLRSFQQFASISYTDLHAVLKESRPAGLEDSSAPARADSAASKPGTDSGLPPLRGPNSTARARMSHQGTVPIDTVSNNVTLRGLVLDHLHKTAASLSAPESDVCYFVDTGRAISPTLTLTYSSSLSSRECAASVLLNYVVVAFEHALQVEFEEALTADDSPGNARTQPVCPPMSTKYHEAFSSLNNSIDTPPCITAMRTDAKSIPGSTTSKDMHTSMHAGTSSGLSDRTNQEFAREGHINVASAYEQLLGSATGTQFSPQQASECEHSGTIVYPVIGASHYTFAVLVGRYIGILSKEVLLDLLARIHAYVSKGYQGLKAALGEDAPPHDRSQGARAQQYRPGGPCVRSGRPTQPDPPNAPSNLTHVFGEGGPGDTATGQASKAAARTAAGAGNMHDGGFPHLTYRSHARKEGLFSSEYAGIQTAMRPGSTTPVGGGGSTLNSCSQNVASMNLDAQDSSQGRDRNRAGPAPSTTGLPGSQQGRQGAPEGAVFGDTLADLMGLLHEERRESGSDGAFQAPYGQGGGEGGVSSTPRPFMGDAQPPKQATQKQTRASWSGQSSGMGTAGEDVSMRDGSFSSDFMPGHRIENPLLRPNKENTGGNTAGQENRNSDPNPPEGRLPQSWTHRENHSGWQAPDQDEYLQEFLLNMLSSFSAIGEGLEKVQRTLECMPPVPPQPDNLTRADCESLRKISLSGTLEWVVACIMMHHHSKLLVCKVCLDTVSPFINRFEVDNMHARLFRSLKFSHIQKSNMARVWREWQRRKRCLDKQQASAMSTLNCTVKNPPVPPTEYSVIHAIANSVLPLSIGQNPQHPQSQPNTMPPPHSSFQPLRNTPGVPPNMPHPQVHAHVQPSANPLQNQGFSMDHTGVTVMPMHGGAPAASATSMMFTAGSNQILSQHSHNALDPMSVNMDPQQQQQQQQMRPFLSFGGPSVPLMTTRPVAPSPHASFSARHRHPRRPHFAPPTAAAAASPYGGQHSHSVPFMNPIAGATHGWDQEVVPIPTPHVPHGGSSGGGAGSTSTGMPGSALSMGMHVRQSNDEVSSSKPLWLRTYSLQGGQEQSGRHSWHGSPFSSPPGTPTFSVGSEGFSQHASRGMLGEPRGGTTKPDPSKSKTNVDATSDTAWPGLAGQCAYTTTSLCKALEDLRQVKTSDGRLYEDFIELRLHPSEIMDARQLMSIYSEHLKYTCPPADTMVLCEIASLQLRREEVFHGIEALAL